MTREGRIGILGAFQRRSETLEALARERAALQAKLVAIETAIEAMGAAR